MRQQFLKELKALLEKYDVTINVTCGECSDLHGVYGERTTITHRVSKGSFQEEEWLSVDDWGLSASDIPEEK